MCQEHGAGSSWAGRGGRESSRPPWAPVWITDPWIGIGINWDWGLNWECCNPHIPACLECDPRCFIPGDLRGGRECVTTAEEERSSSWESSELGQGCINLLLRWKRLYLCTGIKKGFIFVQVLKTTGDRDTFHRTAASGAVTQFQLLLWRQSPFQESGISFSKSFIQG